jgi:hypothetical protein
LQWLQAPNKIKGDKLNSITHEASRHFRSKRREYLKDKIDELATNNKSKDVTDMFRGIFDFKRGYLP